MDKKSAVLYSGGVDSDVLAHHIAQTGDLHTLILIDYGQTSIGRQLNALGSTAAKLKCNAKVIKCDYPELIYPSPELNKPSYGIFHQNYVPANPLSRDELTSKLDSVAEYPDWCWVEGRNLMFFTLASIHAIYNGCSTLYFGLQLNDAERLVNTETYGQRRAADINVHFVNTMNQMLYQAMSKPFSIQAPFAMFNKKQVFNLGISMNMDFSKTTSCEFTPACGICSQCLEVANLKGELGV